MKKKIMSLVLALAMLLGAFPAVFVQAAPYTVNENTEDGITLYKAAAPHTDAAGIPDGTVDITINAYTSGSVSTHTTTTPTDIVLVIDVSGSMDDTQTMGEATYRAVNGTSETSNWGYTTLYGLHDTSTQYYIKNASDEYVTVSRRWSDANGFVYYSYRNASNDRVNVYPIMADGEVPSGVVRSNSYPVVQFYTMDTSGMSTESKMNTMKNAVDSFIDKTMALNENSATGSHIHRIAIVKYATNEFNNTVGNNFNSDGYNYTQLVQDFTRVDTAGAASLKASVNSLTAGGATAIDYGIRMAEQTLHARPDEEIDAHNEVVVVFTDGQPTHYNEYDYAVEGDAINHALALKSTGTTIYSLSVLDPSEGAANTDRALAFMDYLSSNYPEASSDGTTITPGTPSEKGGYFMTPTTGIDLSGLFETIAQDIGSPTISLGANAAVIDTLSPYFNFSDISAPINSIRVETLDKLAEGFAAPVPMTDAAVSFDSAGKIVTVTGFNFDENYISSAPRNGDFYGRMLQIIINVAPDYNVIDGLPITQGQTSLELETNLASHPLVVVDEAGEIAAQTESPTVALNSITYKVDSNVYDVYFRLPGGEHTIITKPTKVGHSFVGWSSAQVDATATSFVMPSENVEIAGNFVSNKYNVTYVYVNGVPADAPALPNDGNAAEYDYGTALSVSSTPAKDQEIPAGYTFSGWYTDDVSVGSDGSYSMPANDVVFEGYFRANGDTEYKIEHYKQKLDGTYPSTPDESYTEYGTTGTNAEAKYLTFEGFTSDTDHPDTKLSGIIAGDGSLVLKLFYERNSYTVKYEYTGTVPTGATALPNNGQPITYKYGELVTVADKASAAGYEFHGWISADVTASAGSFTMPAKDVVINGHFVARGDIGYKVEHYLQKLDGTYSNTPDLSEPHTGTTGAPVEALPKSFEGFTYDAVKTGGQNKGIIIADGSLVLKLYYSRNSYTVTYGYIGSVPTDAPALPNDGLAVTYKYGETVTVAPDAALIGYSFHGWRSIGGTVKEDTVSFTMPAQNVILRGQFTVDSNIKYTVEHYKQVERDSDITDPASYVKEKNTDHTGTTGQPVTALPIYIMGYDFDVNNTSGLNIEKGTVKGDGTLVLKLYYIRHDHAVTYEYRGTVPASAPAVPTPCKHIEGENVIIKATPTVPGYTFKGWTGVVVDGHSINIRDGNFTMPDRDVTLIGHFEANESSYIVEHYLQDLEGTGYTLEERSEPIPASVGDLVVAKNNNYPGFTVDSANDYDGIIPAEGQLVIKLYYNRNTYPVTYRYYGVQPKGVPALPNRGMPTVYKYGQTVDVHDALEFAGYTFNGWYSSQVTPAGGTFTMPAMAVELVGRFEAVRTTGTVEISKKVNAPEGFPGNTSGYTFNIYRDNGTPDLELVQSVYVPTDGSVSVELLAGDYYIYENITKVDGYVLNVICSKDNGKVSLAAGTTEKVEFTNIYAYLDLEKEKHDGYIIGYPDGKVHPERNITRAEAATIFYRMLKDEIRLYYTSSDSSFTDVDKGDWFCTAISTLQNAGVLSGYSDGSFRPNEHITRAEFTKIAVSFYGTHAGRNTHFSDITDHWAEKFIDAAYDYGIVEGYPNGEFKPEQLITRAEAMTIVNRTLERKPHKDNLHAKMIVWPDNMDKTKWYYAEVQEATNSHDYIIENGYEVWKEIRPMRDWASIERGRDDE